MRPNRVIVALSVFATGCAATHESRSASPSGGGSETAGLLVVETIPPGVQVYVDGEPVGLSPTQTKVSSGEHVVVLQRGKRNHGPDFVNVRPGQRTVHVRRLKPSAPTTPSLARKPGRLDCSTPASTADAQKRRTLAAIASGMQRIRVCYEGELARTPSARGRVVFRWTITRKGQAKDVRLATSSGALPNAVVDCVAATIKSLRFCPSEAAVPMEFPFIFRSSR